MDPLFGHFEEVDYISFGGTGVGDDGLGALGGDGDQPSVKAHQEGAFIGRQNKRDEVVDGDHCRDGRVKGWGEIGHVSHVHPLAGSREGELLKPKFSQVLIFGEGGSDKAMVGVFYPRLGLVGQKERIFGL
jgi:hypothetical protein